MHKLMILVWPPPSGQQFEQMWSERFVPQAEKMPGIVRVSVSRPNRSAGAHPRPYLIHEFYFRDRESLRKALASEAGQAAGSALMEFASEYAQIILSEHVEEYRPAR